MTLDSSAKDAHLDLTIFYGRRSSHLQPLEKGEAERQEAENPVDEISEDAVV